MTTIESIRDFFGQKWLVIPQGFLARRGPATVP
jgi:hypothetical protein